MGRRSWGRARWAVVWSTLLAWALRVAWLGRKALWIDEADSLYFAAQPLPTVLFGLCDPHTPGYYLLLKAVAVLGSSEFWLRLPSAVAATLAIPLLFVVGRRLALCFGISERHQRIKRMERIGRISHPLMCVFAFDGASRGEVDSAVDRVAALSALLLAVAPLHVWYAQEARMYALVATLGLVVVLCALRQAEAPGALHALGYTIAATAALFVDQSAALALLLANLAWGWIWVRGARARKWWELGLWVGLQALVTAVFLAWWSRALYPTVSDGGRLYQLTMTMRALQRLGLGVTLEEVYCLFGVLVTVGALAVAALYLASLRYRRRLGKGWAVALVISFLLVTVASAVPRLFTLKRLLLSLLPYFLFAGAWAWHRLQVHGRWLVPVVLASAALCVVNLLLVPKGPWPSVTAHVEARAEPADAIWVDELAVPVFEYYYQGAHEVNALRASEFEAFEAAWAAAEGRLWVVALVDPYRSLFDYLAPDLESVTVEAGEWPRVRVRAYLPELMEEPMPVVVGEPPSWLLTWPSPLDPACEE